jgi:uncharacterized cupin superfamily protein
MTSEKIQIKKLSKEEFENLKIKDWPIWEKEASEFPWEYDETEKCYIIEGEAEITTEDGKKFKIKKDDFVIFQKGLKCNWKIIKDIKKYYSFE